MDKLNFFTDKDNVNRIFSMLSNTMIAKQFELRLFEKFQKEHDAFIAVEREKSAKVQVLLDQAKAECKKVDDAILLN